MQTTGFWVLGSHRLPVCSSISRSINSERLFEQRPDLPGLGAQQFGQHLGRVTVPGEDRLEVVDLFGQHRVHDRFADRLLTRLGRAHA